jgi:hypothetical protein
MHFLLHNKYREGEKKVLQKNTKVLQGKNWGKKWLHKKAKRLLTFRGGDASTSINVQRILLIFFLYKQIAKIQQKSFACIYVCILISPIYSLKNFHLRVEQSVPD